MSLEISPLCHWEGQRTILYRGKSFLLSSSNPSYCYLVGKSIPTLKSQALQQRGVAPWVGNSAV